MNREIKTKKQGRQVKLINPCPRKLKELEIMVGSPKCLRCEYFRRLVNKEDTRYVHCDYIRAMDRTLKKRVEA